MSRHGIVASALASRIDFSAPGFEALVDLYVETAPTELLKNPTLPEAVVERLLGVGTRRIPLEAINQQYLLDTCRLGPAARQHVIRRLRLADVEIAAVFLATQHPDPDEVDAVLDRFLDRFNVVHLSYVWVEAGEHLTESRYFDGAVARIFAASRYASADQSGAETFAVRRYAKCVDEALSLARPGQLESFLARFLDHPRAFENSEGLARFFVDRRPELVERCAHAPSGVLRRAAAASRHAVDPAVQRQLLGLDPSVAFDETAARTLLRSPLCRPDLVDELTRLAGLRERLSAPLALRDREIRNGTLTPVEGPYENLDAAGVRAVTTWLRSRTKQGCSYNGEDPRLLGVIDGLLENPRVDAKDRRYLRAARSRLPLPASPWHVTESNVIHRRTSFVKPRSPALVARKWRAAQGLDPLDPTPQAPREIAGEALRDLVVAPAPAQSSGFPVRQIAIEDAIRALGPCVNRHRLLLSLTPDATVGYVELVELVSVLAEPLHEETPTP